MAEDLRATRDALIKRLVDEDKRQGIPADVALRAAEKRAAAAMPRVERELVDQGKSRPTEIRSK